MKRWTVGFSLIVLLVVAAVPTQAASSCIQVSAKVPDAVCEGQPATAAVSVTNSCASPDRVMVSGALDGKALPGSAAGTIPGAATETVSVAVAVPAALAVGEHMVTITVAEASGATTSTDVPLVVESCTNARPAMPMRVARPTRTTSRRNEGF